MLELNDVASWRAYTEAARAAGATVALVPTMGALHVGHESLLAAAREHGDVVVLTSFVNPRQFDRADDLARYPRTPEHDRAVARGAGVDCFVAPTLAEMWPACSEGTTFSVATGALGARFEGEGRPGHFDGVASVVAKLFAVTGPCVAFFGEKDFQQLAVVRQLVRDFGFDVAVRAVAIVRDDDGLALSSRNVLLSDAGRQRALALSRALEVAARSTGSARDVRALVREELDAADVTVAYVDVVDPVTLAPVEDDASGEYRLLVAGVVEGVRLLDNGPVELVGG